MPLYEFVCGDCNTQFEAIQSFSATTQPNCPVCQSSNVARQISKPAIHFKGSGWYITDSKNTGKQSANGSAKNGNGDAAAGEGAAKENGSGEGSGKEVSKEAGKESVSKESAAPAATGTTSAGSEKSATPAAS